MRDVLYLCCGIIFIGSWKTLARWSLPLSICWRMYPDVWCWNVCVYSWKPPHIFFFLLPTLDSTWCFVWLSASGFSDLCTYSICICRRETQKAHLPLNMYMPEYLCMSLCVALAIPCGPDCHSVRPSALTSRCHLPLLIIYPTFAVTTNYRLL